MKLDPNKINKLTKQALRNIKIEGLPTQKFLKMINNDKKDFDDICTLLLLTDLEFIQNYKQKHLQH